MNNILIFGHKKPDTDSVTAAINLANLKNKLGYKATPYVLGNINNETKFVLNYFNVNEPKYLNDVKLQIKDVEYEKNRLLEAKSSIYNGYLYMNENDINTLPICNNKKYIGATNMREIVKYLVNSNQMELHTSYDNLLEVLEGEEILRFNDDIKGNIIFASFKSTTFIENVKLDSNTILVLGDRHSIIEYAVLCGVKLIIITGNGQIKPEHLELAKKNNVNVIKTNNLSYKTTRLIPLTNYISGVLNKDIITINENMEIDEFLDISKKTKKSNYPVLNKKNECLGILKFANLNNKNKKDVILVDHNEYEQSVDGLEEANIIEIIDHHKIGAHNTTLPINFRNMTVGSTNTIIYKMYSENNINIDKKTAGLMLSGIISDTLLFKSPTTTNDDKDAAISLANIANINYETFAKQMFEAGCTLVGKTIEEIIFGDFKNFNIENKKVGVSQLSTTNAKEILNNKEQYIESMNNIAMNNDYYILAFFITDIIEEGSYMLFANSSKDILKSCFDLSDLEQGQYFEGIISRKKQIIPTIMDTLEKK